MKLQIITLYTALLTTGLMAGIFFTWTNAVTPGIGKLTNMGYLSALQSMNRVILNPLFYLVFLAPVVSLIVTTCSHYGSDPSLVFKLLLLATLIYLGGSFLVTILGNIPLNELLDQANLDALTSDQANQLRTAIEAKWNEFNLVRTIASTASFSILIVALFLR